MATEYAVGLRASYEQCLDASGGVTAALLDCAAAELDHQDRRINAAYKTRLTSLPENQKNRLREDQRKWIVYRDVRCAPRRTGGTGASVGSGGCLVSETAKQAAALEIWPTMPPVLAPYEINANGIQPAYAGCIRLTRGVGSVARKCMEVEFAHQDVRLKKAYEALVRKLPVGEQSRLRIAHGVWVAFRDSHCQSAPTAQSQLLALNDCLVEETAKQAADLEAEFYLNSSES